MIQNEDDQLVELVALDEDNDSDAATADDDGPNDNVDGKHNADPSGHDRTSGACPGSDFSRRQIQQRGDA